MIDPKILLRLIYLTYGMDYEPERVKKESSEIGFKEIKIKQNTKTGYYGLAFIGEDYFVIVHRGTHLINVFTPFATIRQVLTNNMNIKTIKTLCFDTRKDILDDIKLNMNLAPNRTIVGFVFMQEIMSQYPNKEPVQTGHSLGGSMTEFYYSLFNRKVETHVFDSPGSLEILNNYGYNNHIKSINIDTKTIHYYNAFTVNPFNGFIHHAYLDDPHAKYYKIFYFIEKETYSISVWDYLITSLITHSSMMIPDLDITIEKIENLSEIKNWPLGYSQGLKYFYSRANKDGWYIFLNKKYKKILQKSNIKEEDNEKTFDKIFDDFATKYLDQIEDNWSLICKIENLGDFIDQYKTKSIYNYVISLKSFLQKSIFATYKNYKSIDDNLISECIKSALSIEQEKKATSYISYGFENIKKFISFLNDDEQKIILGQDKCSLEGSE